MHRTALCLFCFLAPRRPQEEETVVTPTWSLSCSLSLLYELCPVCAHGQGHQEFHHEEHLEASASRDNSEVSVFYT